MYRSLIVALLLLLTLPAFGQTLGTGAGRITYTNCPSDGTTDATACLQAALNSGGHIIIPGGVYRSATGIVLPAGADVEGGTFNSQPIVSATAGTVILCDLGVAACVSSTANNNASLSLKRLTISRAAGTIPSTGAEGLKIIGADGVVLEDLMVMRQSTAYHFVGAAGFGTILHANRIFSCAVTDTHVNIDGWAVARFNQSYFGCNGTFDVPSNNFVKITGGDGSVGPNTIFFVNSQFNQGLNTAVCAINFQNLGTGQGSAIQDFEFVTMHIETSQNLICSDSSATSLQRLVVHDIWSNGGWGGTNHLFALNAATTPNDWSFIGNRFDGWADITLAPSSQMNGNIFNSNQFLSPVSVTGVSNSTVDFSNNRWGGLTVAGSFAESFFTGVVTNGTYTNTATNPVASNLPMVQNWTPVLTGGTTSGSPTYTTQYGEYWWDGARLTAQFQITFTAGLTGFSGNMAIAGLPATAVNVSNYQGSCSLDGISAVTFATGYTQASLQIASNTTSIQLLENGSGVLTQFLQGSNFTGAGITLAGTCVYRTR